MISKNTLLLTPLFLISSWVNATVGGAQTIEILGYEPKDEKVYLLRHYEDGRGRLPQLYYYDFNNKSLEKPTEVTSIYLDPTTNQPNYDGNEIRFNRELQKITRRLKPLFPINPNIFHIQIEKMKQATAPLWHDPEQNIPEYRYEYQVQHNSHQSKIEQAISYRPELTLKQSYRVPKHNIIITTIQYLAFPEETGYHTEDPVLLFPK